VHSVWRVLAALFGVLALSGCQLDIELDITVEPDGTGTMTVVATADAELVAAVPTIADDLVLDDVIAAGWVVEGPTATPEGGLVLSLTHGFSGAAEATNLLKSLGPPFTNPQLGRGESGDVTTNTLTGNFGLQNGFADFADSDLVSAVGGVPFAEDFAERGATPGNSMTATVRAQLPGEVIDDETNGEVLADGRIEWVIPFEGPPLELSGRTQQAPSEGGSWARPLSIVALVALLAWVGFMTLFISYVAIARWRRNRRYRRRTV
jgi:hypothetical protein